MCVKIAIIDDHPMIAEGISNILCAQSNIEIISKYNTGKDLLDGLLLMQPDILLLDINLPDITGNELARKIIPLYPSIKILVFTNIDNPYHIQDMMKQGCKGYILKTAPPSDLIDAIKTINNNEEYIDASLKEALLQSMLSSSKKGKEVKLTKREKEILVLLCEGLNNYEIGDKLFLSHRTIQNHRMSLYDKFSVKNTAGLVKTAIQLGFVN